MAGLTPGLTPDHPGDPTVRVGIVTSRKLGPAVTRNRIRRRLREAVRAVLREHALPGISLVIVARAGIQARAFREICKEIRALLQNAKTRRSLRSGDGRGLDG